MSLSDLMQDVEDRDEVGNLAIDSDSLLFSSCYEYRDKWDIELAYMNFVGRVESIKRELYKKVTKVEDVVICFTAKSNFRYDIYSDYKATRGKYNKPEDDLLSERTKELKKLIYERIKPICKASNILEADDLVIEYANKGYYVSAIDKDVISQCPTDCFNYKKWEWNDGLSDRQIAKNMLTQSISGDSSDNIKGVKGMGAVKAKTYIDELFDGKHTINDYIDLFETPEDMLMNVRLVNMHQVKDGKLVMTSVEDVFDMICPF